MEAPPAQPSSAASGPSWEPAKLPKIHLQLGAAAEWPECLKNHGSAMEEPWKTYEKDMTNQMHEMLRNHIEIKPCGNFHGKLKLA